MPFQTATTRAIARTIDVPITAGAGDFALGAEWILSNNVAVSTPDDVALHSDVMYAPTTFDTNPHARYDHSIYVTNGFRVSASVRHLLGTDAEEGTGNGGQLGLYQLGSDTRIGVAGITNLPTASDPIFFASWGTPDVRIAFTGVFNSWYRVGIEVEPDLDEVRFYLNTTANPSSVVEGNAGLILQRTLKFGDVVTTTLYAGANVASAALAAPSAPSPNFNGFDALLIEEFVPRPFMSTLPTGAHFELPVTPYAFYKTTMTIYNWLNNARFV